MSQICKVYMLLNRDFSSGSAESTKRKILQMNANGRTYASQLASDAEIVVHVVGVDMPFRESGHVLAALTIDRIIPESKVVASDMLDHATFGWFEFDDGLKGAIAAYFGPPPNWMRSETRSIVRPIESIATKPSFPQVERNASCPCGSGQKYKNCHGKLA